MKCIKRRPVNISARNVISLSVLVALPKNNTISNNKLIELEDVFRSKKEDIQNDKEELKEQILSAYEEVITDLDN